MHVKVGASVCEAVCLLRCSRLPKLLPQPGCGQGKRLRPASEGVGVGCIDVEEEANPRWPACIFPSIRPARADWLYFLLATFRSSLMLARSTRVPRDLQGQGRSAPEAGRSIAQARGLEWTACTAVHGSPKAIAWLRGDPDSPQCPLCAASVASPTEGQRCWVVSKAAREASPTEGLSGQPARK